MSRQLAPWDRQTAALDALHWCCGVEDAFVLVVRYHVQLDKYLAAADVVLAAYPEPGQHVLVYPRGRLQGSSRYSTRKFW